MRNFWSFYGNGNYRVGCNGATIYVYDLENKEIGRLKDIKYAYVGAFQPGTNIFVAKSTEGSLAVYDLDRMELLKKIVITRLGAQDEGFAFTPNGAFFFNIEKPFLSYRTQLTIYRTTDFEIVKELFCDNKVIFLEALEFDENSDDCYVLGFMRDNDGIMDYGFIGKLVENQLVEMKPLNEEEYDYISAYKSWERSGYTQRHLEWQRIRNYAEKPPVQLKQVHGSR